MPSEFAAAPAIIHLNHNEFTPLAPEVREEMISVWDRLAHTRPSPHRLEAERRAVLTRARTRVARFIGARPEEIVFTSGGTEANNLAILGGARALAPARTRIVTSMIEHDAVLNACGHLAEAGHGLGLLPVDPDGRILEANLDEELEQEPGLVAVMLANNETGVVQPVARLARMARARGARIHTDASAAAGKIRLDVGQLGVDYLALSARKLRGPAGAGALYVRSDAPLRPTGFGGWQERGLRPGAENLAALAGFGKACEMAGRELATESRRLAELRNLFEAELKKRISGAVVNGAGAPRLPHTANIRFAGVLGEEVVRDLDERGVATSAGAEYHESARTHSHVLLAMGQTPVQARSAVRFSLGHETTFDDIFRGAELVRRSVDSVRLRTAGKRKGALQKIRPAFHSIYHEDGKQA